MRIRPSRSFDFVGIDLKKPTLVRTLESRKPTILQNMNGEIITAKVFSNSEQTMMHANTTKVNF